MSGVDEPLTRLERLAKVVSSLKELAAALVFIIGYAQGNRLVALVGLFGLLGSVLWYVVARRARRRQRPAIAIPENPRAYLRGALPFQVGEAILGRDADSASVLARVTSADFRFGYLTGDAGVGKTSLIRAALIPGLEQLGFPWILVNRPADSVVAAITRAIEMRWELTPSGGTLRSALVAAANRIGSARCIVIVDQLEEYLMLEPSRQARQDLASELANCLRDTATPHVAFLVCLRRDFVDDLQDFAPSIAQPLDVRFATRLLNFSPPLAREVLRAMLTHDSVPFYESLVEQIATDLTYQGLVRPVELQLVATRCRERQIETLGEYRSAGGARQIIAEFVKEVISPPGASILESEVGNVLLRLLCADNTDTRRPIGLTFDELASRISATVLSADRSLSGPRGVDEALKAVLDRCLLTYLVVAEDEQRFNLAHDYLAHIVRIATSSTPTIEETANRILARLLADRDTIDTVPIRHLYLIYRYASPATVSDIGTRGVLRRIVRRKFQIVSVSAAVLAMLGMIAFRPPMLAVTSSFQPFDEASWHFARTGALAVGVGKKERALVWTPERLVAVNADLFGLEWLRPNPTGTWIAGRAIGGGLVGWRAGDGASPTIYKLGDYFANSVTFSNDGRWLAFQVYGHVFLTDLTTGSPEPKKLLSVASRGDPVLEPEPTIIFSPDSTALAIIGSDGAVYVGSIESRRFEQVDKVKVSKQDPLEAAFDGKGSVLAVLDREKYEVHLLSRSDKSRRVFRLYPEERGDEFVKQAELTNIGIIDSGRWLFAKNDFGSLYLWRADAASPIHHVTHKPYFGLDRYDTNDDASISIAADERWAAIASPARGIYVIDLNKYKDSSQIEPIVPIDNGGDAVALSPGETFAALANRVGEIYVVSPARPVLDHPVAKLANVKGIRFRWSADERTLVVFGGSDVFLGSPGGELQLLAREQSAVRDVTISADRKTLLIFCDRGVRRLQRQWTAGGLALGIVEWPTLVRDSQVVVGFGAEN